MKHTRRAVIVGAGPGGLAAALLLAKSGVKVTIVEKRPEIGGRTSTMEQGGFSSSTWGLRFFCIRGAAGDLCGGGLRPGPRSADDAARSAVSTGVWGGWGVAGYAEHRADDAGNCGDFARGCSAVSTLYYAQPGEAGKVSAISAVAFRELERPDEARDDEATALLAPWRSLDSDLQVHFKDERIRLGFSFQSKYLGMSPFRCPSLFSILSFLEYEHGVFHPTGGCGAVTRTMARIAEEMGVEILLDEPVDRVMIEGGKAVGVKTATRTLAADAVVVNADFAGAMRRMVPNAQRKKWTDERMAKKRFSCSTFMMYLGIDGRYDDVSHHTIFLAKDYKQNLRDIEELHQLSVDPSFYVQNACVTDPTLAPKGQSTLYVLLPVTHESEKVDWDEGCAALSEAGVAADGRRLGLHDVERRIVTERIVTPTGWASEFDLYKGATFSMAHSLDQMLHLRPHNRFEDVRQMYLVGGGTHPGSGLPVIFESARITSRLLLEDLDMETQWSTQAGSGFCAFAGGVGGSHLLMSVELLEERRRGMGGPRPVVMRRGWAAKVQRAWAERPVAERVNVLTTWRHAVSAQTESFCRAIDAGAARTDADVLVTEILPLLAACEYLEDNAAEVCWRARQPGRRGKTVLAWVRCGARSAGWRLGVFW